MQRLRVCPCVVVQTVVPRHPSNNPEVVALYRDWIGGAPGSLAARGWLHTLYHDRIAEVGQCRWTVSKPELKARLVSTLETKM
jgi:hypothetical protein